MTNMHTIDRAPLAKDWNLRRREGNNAVYDVVVIGSGYGGAITAARLATAGWPNGKPTLCVLERGKEWLPGEFPDNLSEGAANSRSSLNPLGLYDLQFGPDIGVITGSGLGGTSLVNANVVFQPDGEVFEDLQWPQKIRDDRDSGTLQTYFDRARTTLFAERHPDGLKLSKVKALKNGADASATAKFDLVDIAVNFKFEGDNNWRSRQRKCINCGDCITGCNVGAKNTLDTNYLAIAKWGGADLFTQVEAKRIEKLAGGGYLVHYIRRNNSHAAPEEGTIKAKRTVVVSAGALGSAEIMLRSRSFGLKLPDSVGTRFSGNGDFFGLAYNSDDRTDVLGWGAYPASARSRRIQPSPNENLHPGPTIVARIKYGTGRPLDKRTTVEDVSFPLMYADIARAFFIFLIGRDTDPDDFIDNFKEAVRRASDFAGIGPELEKGALNHTLMYLVMGHDDAGGRIEFDDFKDGVKIRWPGVGSQSVFRRENRLIGKHAAALGATFVENPLWGFIPMKTLVTAHPLGGCPMAEDNTKGLVNHAGQVYAEDGSLHEGLYIADGSIVPTSIGVNPLMTISALSERIAEQLVKTLGGLPNAIDQIL